ncbi:MAG: hypothetical protein GF333_05460 [Candidatus Omnitrophica bacterium]|nr:hypothetical protein [Candidatus Omnitrophota bacterium]
MKIAVEKLQEKEIVLHESIPARNWDLDSNDVKFIKDISLTGKFRKLGSEVVVDTETVVRRRITCSRCLEEAVQEVPYTFTLNFALGDIREFLEIDEAVREEILLRFPMKVLCRPDCKGMCPACGVNRNNEPCSCQTGVSHAAARHTDDT